MQHLIDHVLALFEALGLCCGQEEDPAYGRSSSSRSPFAGAESAALFHAEGDAV